MMVGRIFRSRSRKVWLAAGLTLVATLMGNFIAGGTAQAIDCWDNGRACGHGYFTNAGPSASGVDLFTPAGTGLQVNNLNEFITTIAARIKCTNPGTAGGVVSVPMSDRNATSSSFIVLTMLGAAPGTNRNQACVRWTEWTNKLTAYDSAGMIHYNEFYDMECVNTAFSTTSNDVFYFAQCGSVPSVVVYSQYGYSMYAIKRDSGSPIGYMEALSTPLGYQYRSNVENVPGQPAPLPANGSSTSAGSAVAPGQTIKLNVTAQNIGDASGPASKLQGKMFQLDPASGQEFNYYDANCGGSCYNTPAQSVPPQRGINYVTGEGILYNPTYVTNVPALAPGQKFTGAPVNATATPYTISFTIPANAPDGRKVCFYAHIEPTSASVSVSTTSFGAMCFIVKYAPAAVCGAMSVSPSSLDPSSPYTISASVNYDTAANAAAALAAPGTRFFVTVQGPGVNTTLNSVTPINQSGTALTVTTPQQPPTGQTGQYRVGWGIAGSAYAVNCGAAVTSDPNPPSFTVSTKPYFSVLNGDIAAGAGMSIGGTDCAAALPANDKASIVGWNRGGAYGYAGAGTTHGGLALGFLQDFATGQTTGLAPDGASFANGADGQVNTGGGKFGGKFGSMNCAADYFANANNVQTGNITIGATAVPNCTGSNDNVCRRTIYVNGNVHITSNITFSGNYAGPTAVPAFSIIASGNIYIAPGVTQLDGFYIAQPSSAAATNGVIYTCAPTPFTAAVLDFGLSTSCNAQLTVNGAFVGRQVWLLRAAGSISSTPAETFNYSPELWLSMPYGNGLSDDISEYDSITGLPPVL